MRFAMVSGAFALLTLLAACGPNNNTVPPSLPISGALTPTLSVTSLNFDNSTATSQTVSVNESYYSGLISQTNTCSGIATVSPASAPASSATFTVTAVSGGTCTVTFTDSYGHAQSASIVVSTLGFNVQSKAEER